jgi:polar amino acid transport system substrate-binding protein
MNKRMTSRKLAGLLSGFLLALISYTALAVPVDCGSKPIGLAYFEFGFFYFENDGHGKGIDKDVVDELAVRTGCKFVTQVMPRARVFVDLASGELDMSVVGIKTPEREQFAWFIPYATAKNYTLVVGTAGSSVRDAEGFLNRSQLQFGVVRGFKHGEEQDKWLEKMRQAARVEESASVNILFEKLKLGRINGMFSQPAVYRKNMKDMNMGSEVSIQDWFPSDKGVIGSLMLAKARFSEAEAARWGNIIREMRTDGTMERIFARYVSAAEAKKLLVF